MQNITGTPGQRQMCAANAVGYLTEPVGAVVLTCRLDPVGVAALHG
jgi:hypothetical protein